MNYGSGQAYPTSRKRRDREETVQAQIAANPGLSIGVFEVDRLAGVVLATMDGRKGWLNRLAVDPDFRRRGVARTLIHEAETALRKQRIRIFCALIEDDNSASTELFKASGYREHGDIIYFSKRGSGQI